MSGSPQHEHVDHVDHVDHVEHRADDAHDAHDEALAGSDLTRSAVSATLHCLTGCSIGEVLGMVIGTAAGLGGWATVVLSIVLASASARAHHHPGAGAGLPFRKAAKVALASDTVSIATMEVTDNAVVLLVPGALNAGLSTVLFWASLGVSLVVAFVVTVPVNRALIRRGRGHAVIHDPTTTESADAVRSRLPVKGSIAPSWVARGQRW